MTEFQPTPQTPEQVDEGLRNAFRQAIKDGVMDATPYLKQMTYKSDIQKTEKEIAVLQKKLDLLKEIETHKSQPKMTFDYGGKFEIVSYNYEEYLRLEFNDGSHNWSKRKHTVDGVVMVAITDGETHRLLEGLWFNDVKKGKYDDVVDEHKSPVENAYRVWWGQYPELETDSKYDDTRWQGFQAGFQAAYEEKVREDDDVVDEPYKNVKAYWDKKDNPASYITDEVVNRLVEKHKSQKLWNILSNKCGFSEDACGDIVSAVEKWLPKEQSAAGSQNVDTELLVDGFNDCLRKIKEMLR